MSEKRETVKAPSRFFLPLVAAWLGLDRMHKRYRSAPAAGRWWDRRGTRSGSKNKPGRGMGCFGQPAWGRSVRVMVEWSSTRKQRKERRLAAGGAR